MAYPTAVGTPSLSGTYIPTIFSTRLLIVFYLMTVFGAICNTDYEGEIKQFGDKIQVSELMDAEIHEFVKGADLEVTNISASAQEMLIDKGFYWNIADFDVDKVQSNIAYREKLATHYSKTLKERVDAKILASIYADAHAANTGDAAGIKSGNINLGKAGAPVVLTKTNVLEWIIDIGTVLYEQNVPYDDGMKNLVIPPAVSALIKKSDLREVSVSGDQVSLARNGRLGMIDQFTLYISNNLHSAVDGGTSKLCYDIIANHKSSTSFAAQIDKSETLRNPKQFGDLIRQLFIYGFKTFKPEALVHSYVTTDAS